MIYAWFTLWLFLIIFTGMGIFRLLARLTKTTALAWILLPGTFVSEIAYIIGCLVTGGEIKRAKIVPEDNAKGEGGDQVATESTPKLKIIGPVLASLVAITACGAGIIAAHSLLGGQVINTFVGIDGKAQQMALAPLSFMTKGKEAPGSVKATIDRFWDQAHEQVHLLRRMTETLTDLNWKDWRVGLFVYLSICLAVRLSPATRPIRPTLGAAVLIAGIIAGLGLLWTRFENLMQDIWPLLTYTWALLLFLLVVTLLITGVVGLIKILAGKTR